MGEINQLARELMALDDKLVSCMKCGLCQAVCPVFGETMMEADVTRGKIALLENLAHKIISDAAAVNEKLGRCLLCGSCQANCPSGVAIMDIFLRARGIVATYLGLSPVKKIIFRTLLPNAGLFNLSMRMGQPFQGLVMRRDGNAQNTSTLPLFKALVGDRHTPRLAAKPLHARFAGLDTPAGKSGLKVLFYPGCMSDKFYTRAGIATLKVLEHHGVGITLPPGLTCCGIPALASGDSEGFTRQVKANLDVFEAARFDYVLSPCASCTATIKEMWSHYAPGLSAKESALALSMQTKAMDISQFLVDVLGVQPVAQAAPDAKKITYHDSCHLKKSLGVSAQPRALLKANQAYQLVEMAEADRCCGCGGSFTLFHYDLSEQIGQRKRGNIVASGADVVCTGCPACMMQLGDMLAKHNDKTIVKHVMEIYAESLPHGPQTSSFEQELTRLMDDNY